MGTWSMVSRSYRTAWFTEPDPSAGVERIAAVVVRRVDRSATVEGSDLRYLLRLFWWMLLFKLRIRRRTPPPKTAPRPLPEGWNGGVDHDKVLYSRDRGVVRVYEREHLLPGTAETLIVLVDESVKNAAATIETHNAPAPTAPWSEMHSQMSREEFRRRSRERNEAARVVWREWLAREPAIRKFLAK